MTNPRILSVGQCGYDHRNLAGHLSRRLRAELTPASTSQRALAELHASSYHLILVNRIIDGDGSSGLELIRTLKAEPSLAGVPVMLVSDLPDAQDQAVDLGALRGFGKSRLADPRTFDLIAAVLSATADSPSAS